MQNGIGLGKRMKMVGIDGFRRWGVGREGVGARQGEWRWPFGKVSIARRAWVSSSHLDTSFGPQLRVGLHLFFLGI